MISNICSFSETLFKISKIAVQPLLADADLFRIKEIGHKAPEFLFQR
jgi:hypothetical protein